jgi:tryptophanyl-tRNA synthetase
LQAADILIYQADRVPVGDDQRQHLELARDIAGRFNARFGETFTLPQAAIPKVGARIMDLQHPGTKMSKSIDSPQGTVLVLDPPETIAKKVKTAVTDSGRDIVIAPDKPAISNLLTIYAVATGLSLSEAQAQFAEAGYADFKRVLTDALVEFLRPVRDGTAALLEDPAEIARILESGAQKAQTVAAKTIASVYDRVGFVLRH